MWIPIWLLACGGPEAEPEAPTPAPEPAQAAGVCLLKAKDPAGPHWGCVDGGGSWVVPPRYLGLTVPAEVAYGLALGGKREIIDLRADEPRYLPIENVGSLRDLGGARFAFKRDGRWGLMDESGQEKVGPSWYRVEAFSEERAAFCLTEQRCGFVDRDGVVVAEPRWSEVEPFSEGRAAVRGPAGWGFLDADGSEVIPPRYVAVTRFSGERAFAATGDGRWAVLDPSGTEVGSLSAKAVLPFSDGRGAFQREGKWGFVDRSGREVIAPRFVQVRPFSEERAAVQSSPAGPFGYADPDGTLVIAAQFGGPAVGVAHERHAWMDFSQGVAIAIEARAQSHFGLLGRDGSWVVEPRFDAAERVEHGFTRVSLDGAVFHLAPDGREIRPQSTQ